MLDTRRHKVAGDILGNKARSALVILSIAIAVACVGMVGGARVVILAGLSRQYLATTPANASLSTDPFGSALLRRVRQTSGVRVAEGRYTVDVRLKAGQAGWTDVLLVALPNFRHQSMNKVFPQTGAWPPPAHQMLIERASLESLDAATGDRVTMEMPNGRQRVLRIGGTAHDIIQPATPVSGVAYAYVTFPTLRWLGLPLAYNQLDLLVTGNAGDISHVRQVASRVRAVVERSGRRVSATIVPQPGKLWVYDAVQSMLLLLGVLGAGLLAMSAFLLVNTSSAQVLRQMDQIGVMKAIGARRRQLVGMYLATVLCFGLLALVIGIPLGVVGAIALINYATQALDFDTAGSGLSPGVLGLELVAGVAVPLAAALIPVLRGSGITVRQAITSRGSIDQHAGPLNLDRGPGWLDALPRPVLLSVGNTFRRRGRLALTMGALILGGATFIAVLSVRATLLHTLDDIFAYRNYDVQASFSRPYAAARVTRLARQVPGVVRAEGWGVASAQRMGGSAADLLVLAPPAGSNLIKPTMLQGRWPGAGDRHAVAVNSDAVAGDPGLRAGRRLWFRIDGHASEWTVVGVVRGVQEGPIMYLSYPDLTRITGQQGLVERLQVVTQGHDGLEEATIGRALEVKLKHAGFEVTSLQTTVGQRAVLAADFDSIVVFLLVMAILLGVAGGLGLMGTMAMAVLDRRREIGIMRAIGASDRDTLQVVLVEGAVIALLSWIGAVLLSLLLSPVLAGAVGDLFLHAPVAYTYSVGGAVLWLLGAVTIALLASLWPAWTATRLTVRETLAYE